MRTMAPPICWKRWGCLAPRRIGPGPRACMTAAWKLISRRTFPKGPVNYESKKKTARRLSPSSSRVQGLRREPITKLLYQILGKNASPNPDKRGGIFPVSWEFMLTVIGSGFLVSQLSRFIDWIERG